MTIFAPEKTAIKRNKLSAPMRAFFRPGNVDKRRRILDYGCGRGDDVRLLKEAGYKIHGYDPYPAFGFLTPLNQGRFHVVTCNYVLNTLDSYNDRIQVIRDAWRKVAPGGFLFLSVRSKSAVDKAAREGLWLTHEDGYVSSHSKKTFQKGFTIREIGDLLWNATLSHVHVILTDPQPVDVKDCVTALIQKEK